MITIRKSHERGHIVNDWLDTYHTFSFGEYYDPTYTHFQSLRVINEDKIKPASGFPLHSHKDMEIITYIISGAIEHIDSLGNKGKISRGEIQLMRAGSGISHSEYNPSITQETHLLQIWIFPKTKSLEPYYQQKQINLDNNLNKLLLIASPDGENGSFTIIQDAKIYAAHFNDYNTIYNMPDGHNVWVQVISGTLLLNNISINSGDGAAIIQEKSLTISGDGEFILFDLKNSSL